MSLEETVEAVAAAASWDARIALVRRVPETFGQAQHAAVYAAIAKKVYVPNLAPDFAYVHWREEYELAPLDDACRKAVELTKGFFTVEVADLRRTLHEEPTTLRIFRLLLGLTVQEFAAASKIAEARGAGKGVTAPKVKDIEAGGASKEAVALCCATVVDGMMRGTLFGKPSGEVRSKIEKPDTMKGWETVQQYADEGVPLAVFLHQRHYGGAFRQLLDSTSTMRGDILEDAVEELFRSKGILYVRTGSHDQEEIARRFHVTVRPAPDFVVYEGQDVLKALLECKGANDGGTARDKADRFSTLRGEATRLGGVPVFAVLAGLGWRRTRDALGPVIRDTDGRTFTIPTLPEMLTVQPFPGLVR